MTPRERTTVWQGNWFKISAYAAYLLLVVFYLGLIRAFLSSGDVFSTTSFGFLLLLTGCFVILFLRGYPNRLRFEEGEVEVDFGVLAGTRRFLSISRTDIRDVSLTISWPFSVVKVYTGERTYSWILSNRPALELMRHKDSTGGG